VKRRAYLNVGDLVCFRNNGYSAVFLVMREFADDPLDFWVHHASLSGPFIGQVSQLIVPGNILSRPKYELLARMEQQADLRYRA